MLHRWPLAVVLFLPVAIPCRAQRPSLIPDDRGVIDASRGGKGQAFRMHSSILNETRRINVVLPASFSRTGAPRRYPVTIVLDGESNLPVTAVVSDELVRNGQIPETILVAIENTSRLRDLTPPGLSVSGSDLNQGGDKFLDFIDRELLPEVDRQFRGAAPRIMIGHSSGAILATWAAATRSTYSAVIAIDAPIQLGENWLARKLMARAASGLPPLRYAAYQAKFPWPEEIWNALVASAPASWMLRRDQMRLEGHETVVMQATYMGLREVFRDYSRLAAREEPVSRLVAYYRDVGAAFGGTLVPPRATLRDALSELLDAGQAAAAREAYALLSTGYGAPGDSALLLARIVAVERRPARAETVEGLLATPFPTPDEARPFVGDWKGDQWFKPDEPRTGSITLRIRLENGKVIGEVLNPAAPQEMRVRRVDYLRVTAVGLTWGFLNRMQPRGVMLHEGSVRGDTLSGKSRFGGIDLSYPPGSAPDPGFRLVRDRR